MRIKITQSGWETYSDVLGQVQFQDGVSVGDITRREALALGAFVTVVELNEDGDELGPVSPAHDALLLSKITCYSDRATNLLYKVNNTPSVTAEIENLSDDTSMNSSIIEARRKQLDAERVVDPPALPARQPLTQNDLEAIATSKGITGLREVAERFGVKDTSIRGLIGQILKAQRQAKV